MTDALRDGTPDFIERYFHGKDRCAFSKPHPGTRCHVICRIGTEGFTMRQVHAKSPTIPKRPPIVSAFFVS